MRTLFLVLVLTCSLFAQEQRIFDGVSKLDSIYSCFMDYGQAITKVDERANSFTVPNLVAYKLEFELVLVLGRLYRYEKIERLFAQRSDELLKDISQMMDVVMSSRTLDTDMKLKGAEICKGIKKIIEEYKLNE